MTKLLAQAISVILGAIPGMLRDVVGLCGACLVSYGAWLIYPPAGFIVGGVLLIVGTLVLAVGHRTAV